MTQITSALRRDANKVPLQDVNGIEVIASITFEDTTGAQTLYTVTGDVIIRVFGVCKTDVASGAAANIEVGVSGTTGLFIATTVATAVDANEIWHDSSPDKSLELDSVSVARIVSNGQNVILTPSAQVDSGRIDFYLSWRPLSNDADVVAA